MSENSNEDQEMVTLATTGRLFVSTVFYPLENAEILIQLGHEPLPPYPTKTPFGTPVLGYPNIFKYVKHIYQTDGLRGCYRGVFPWISTNLLYTYTLNQVKENFPPIPNEDMDEDDLEDEQRLTLFCGVLIRGVVSRTVAIVVSHPLHVITIRTIAQYIGGEVKYTGILTGLWTVLKEEGIWGLFSGLLPRLLGEIFTYTVATTGVYLIHQHLVRDRERRKYVDAVMQCIASALFYSFTVVGSCMAVTNSGLAAGSPPKMPHYHHMFDCWSHLQGIGQLKRGSSVLWRYYTPFSPAMLSERR